MSDATWVAVASIVIALINMLGSVAMAFIRHRWPITAEYKNGVSNGDKPAT